MNILYKLHSGKNSKIAYYLRSYLSMAVPDALLRRRLKKILRQQLTAEERTEVEWRTAYYCKHFDTRIPDDARQLDDHKLKNRNYPSVYFFDSREFTRYFPKHLRWNYIFGDVIHTPDVPSIVKSRPIGDDNANAVLLNLDKIRHFVFLDDRIPFTDKSDKAIFRGDVRTKSNRLAFMQRWFGSTICDAGDTTPAATADKLGLPAEWRKGLIPLRAHLHYKFILALEGNDVASNLKWVMSSNSLAVMPRPKYETWFMEGTLIPGVHYVEIADDFSDLEEKMSHYIAHPDEAEAIIANAHRFVARFRNPRIERLISLNVLQRYFEQTGQLPPLGQC